MKFGQQIHSERVPEWAEYYMDYKLGKKKIQQYQSAKYRGAVNPGRDFDEFCRTELFKVDNFYRLKEQAAVQRMIEIKWQFNVHEEQVLFARALFEPSQNHDDFSRPRAHRRDARKMLKHALIEFYRGLDLVNSFGYMNSVAFRKLNKKFDKTRPSAHRPLLRYYKENVERAHFFKSDVVDGLIDEVEQIYAKHYEKGNRKAARDDLKAKSLPDWKSLSAAQFVNGLSAGVGLTLGTLGLISGFKLLLHSDPQKAVEASYLLQLYGGYFLVVLLAILHAVSCFIFEQKRINFTFIFQLNAHYSLNWREILVLPLMFFAFLGVCMFSTFSVDVENPFYRRSWPVILMMLTVTILFLPIPTLFHRSRKWFLKHIGGLVISPFVDVTFPHFFIGDLVCSLAYSISNIEIFFCLYAQKWETVDRCNSSNSRLLGFLTALPAVWRALQCLRRSNDTRNSWPHIPNFGKYIATSLAYMCLSLYRIDKGMGSQAAYITFASINSIYTILWDVKIDWSLGDTDARGLREDLSWPKKPWIYWLAILFDILIRCNWVVYLAVKQYPQHSSLAAFMVALTEVLRRGVWIVFRVENEHWGNVRTTYAYRDPPLPYKLAQAAEPPKTPVAPSPADEEQNKPQAPAGGLRRRRGIVLATGALSRLSSKQSVLQDVHMQDYSRNEEAQANEDTDGSSTEEEEDREEAGRSA